MKKTCIALALAGLTAGAQAADYSLSIGDGYQQLTRTPQGGGIGLTLDYLNTDHKGSAGGAGLEFALPLGSLTLAAGAKAMWLSPDTGSATAAMLGGRANFAFTPKISLYGQAYYSPDGLVSGSVQNVSDVSAGVRWNVVGPFMVEAGYRHFDIERKDSSRSRTLADGPFISAGLSF